MSQGNWSKSARNDIWLNYIDEIIWDYFNESIKDDWDLTQEAPCCWCGRRMVKAAYIGLQPNEGPYSWDVDHINNNYRNNDWDNLQPMHPRCNKRKGVDKMTNNNKANQKNSNNVNQSHNNKQYNSTNNNRANQKNPNHR